MRGSGGMIGPDRQLTSRAGMWVVRDMCGPFRIEHPADDEVRIHCTIIKEWLPGCYELDFTWTAEDLMSEYTEEGE